MGYEVRKLELNERFEKFVVYYMCESARFWRQVGGALNPDALGSDTAAWMARAAQAVAQETGRPPASAVRILQRLKRWNTEGQFRTTVLDDAVSLLEDVEDDPARLDEESVVQELVPIVRRQQQQSALRTALDEFTRHGDLSDAVSQIEAANRLGRDDSNSKGIRLSADALGEIVKLRSIERLTTGVNELDFAIDGGLPRGSLGVVIGGSGDGKSMSLTQQAATAVAQGMFVLYATLELPEEVVMGRITSALTNVPLTHVLSGSSEAVKRLKKIEDRLGMCEIREFTAKAATSKDILGWLDELERAEGRRPDVLIVDYADKLTAPKERDEYGAMRVVYEDLRVGVHERNVWGWTASQARRSQGQRRLDLQDAADSLHKVRIADLVLTVNVRDVADMGGEREVEVFVAKNRHGESRAGVGPLAVDFQFGRLLPSDTLRSL